MTVFAYLRVSTDLQTVENQRNKIESSGYAITEWFEDSATSGSTSAFERVGFKALLAKATAGSTIVSVEVSRIGRSTSDVLNVIEYLRKNKIRLVIMNLDGIDLTSSTGRLMLTLMAGCATFERDLIVERVKSGLNRTVAEGTILGAPRKTSPEALKSILEDIEGGVEHSIIAKQYGISLKTVGRYKRMYLKDKSNTSLEEYSVLYNKQKEQISKKVVANI